MNNKKGQPQKRGISYEKKKAKDHKAKHIPTCTQQIFQKIIWLRYNKNCLLKLILSY